MFASNYDVIWGNDIEQLVTKVKEKINDGWQPIGGVCVTAGDRRCYYQAVIKE